MVPLNSICLVEVTIVVRWLHLPGNDKNIDLEDSKSFPHEIPRPHTVGQGTETNSHILAHEVLRRIVLSENNAFLSAINIITFN